jgi:hypothetical protein
MLRLNQCIERLLIGYLEISLKQKGLMVSTMQATPVLVDSFAYYSDEPLHHVQSFIIVWVSVKQFHCGVISIEMNLFRTLDLYATHFLF